MITAKLIQRVVCEYYGVSMIELLSARRQRWVMPPRHMAMYLTRHHTGLSFPAIATAFKKDDHSTVHHANARIEKLIESNDTETLTCLSEIREALKQAIKRETLQQLNADLEQLTGEEQTQEPEIDLFASEEELEVIAAKAAAQRAEMLAREKTRTSTVIRYLNWMEPESPFCQAVAALAVAEINYRNTEGLLLASARRNMDEAVATVTSEWRRYQAMMAEQQQRKAS